MPESRLGGTRGHQREITEIYHSAVTAFESLPTGEEYTESGTRKRGTLKVMNKDGDHVCPE